MKAGAINLRGDSAGEQDEGLDAAVAGPAYKCQVREGGPTIHSASTGYIIVTGKISLKNGCRMRRILLKALVCFIYVFIFLFNHLGHSGDLLHFFLETSSRKLLSQSLPNLVGRIWLEKENCKFLLSPDYF